MLVLRQRICTPGVSDCGIRPDVKVLHVISPVRYGGGEALLVSLLQTPEMNNACVATVYQSVPLSAHLSELGVEEIRMSPMSLGDGTTKLRAFFHCWTIPWLILRLAKLVRRSDIGLVHVHSFPATFVLALLRRIRVLQRPLVITRHSELAPRRWFTRSLYVWMFASADAVTTVSHTLRHSMLCKFPDLQIDVIHNCVASPFFAVADPPNRYSDRRRFIQIARFSRDKNHLVVLDALARMSPAQRGLLSVWFAGSGAMEATVKRRAAELDLGEECVSFLGFVKQHELPVLLDEVDFGLFPSTSEGFGLGAAECLAAGRPVLALDTAVMREVVGSGGMRVSVDQLREGMLEMVRVGDTLRSHARRQAALFPPQVVAGRYAKVYMRVSDGPATHL